MNHVLVLDGLRPEPLASYLSAVGVLRLVGEQADRNAAGRWVNDHFELRTSLSQAELIEFFLDRYVPTPFVAPWNGGSGFHRKDNTDARDTIMASDVPRLAAYRSTIAAADQLMLRPEWPDDLTKHKAVCIELCRAWLPDDALHWIDAAVVLTDVREGREFPPLLGTGGNVGRLEFSNNFMQRIVDVLTLGTGRRAAQRDDTDRWLKAQLFGEPTPMAKQPVGQFNPSAAGGANMGPQAADALVNPWGYVLMLEGAVVFASGAARRMGSESASAGAMPFTVRPTAAGYSTASEGESVKGELWLPLWSAYTTKPEIDRLVREGRLAWGRRQANDGLDAARAVATLGTDRGVSAFVRFAIAERLGQAMLAIPVGRAEPDGQNVDYVAATSALDGWLNTCRRIKEPPASVTSGIGAYERAVLDLVRRPGARALLEVLIAAAALDSAIGRSASAQERVRPLTIGDAQRWCDLLPLDLPEVRLAAAIASASFGGFTASELMRPIQRERGRGRFGWTGKSAVVGGSQRLNHRLTALLEYRSLAKASAGGEPDAAEAAIRGVDLRPQCRMPARLDDVSRFLSGAVNDDLIGRSLDALLLLNWGGAAGVDPGASDTSAFASPALSVIVPFTCARPTSGHWRSATNNIVAGRDWARLLRAGRGEEVLADACRRLRVAGRRPLVRSSIPDLVSGDRLAAAVAIPVHPRDAVRALDLVAPAAASEAHPDPESEHSAQQEDMQ